MFKTQIVPFLIVPKLGYVFGDINAFEVCVRKFVGKYSGYLSRAATPVNHF